MNFEGRRPEVQDSRTEQKRKNLLCRLLPLAPVLAVLWGGYESISSNGGSDATESVTKPKGDKVADLQDRLQQLIGQLSNHQIEQLYGQIENLDTATPNPEWEQFQAIQAARDNDPENNQARLEEYQQTKQLHNELKQYVQIFPAVFIGESNDGTTREDRVIGGKLAIGIKSTIDFGQVSGLIITLADGRIIINLMQSNCGVKEFNSIIELKPFLEQVNLLGQAVNEAKQNSSMNGNEGVVKIAEQALQNYLQQLE